MYLPRSLISHLYTNLLRNHHSLSPPVVLLVALEPDALCACRILTLLLKRDYIQHKIKPIAGYRDLARAGQSMVQSMKMSEGGSGGVVVCLGVGGLVDLEATLGLGYDEEGNGGPEGVEVWVFDSRRPWTLANVFGSLPGTQPTALKGDALRKVPGADKGQLSRGFKPGSGGIFVYDDGDIEQELSAQRDAWYALDEMPELDDDGEETDRSDDGYDSDKSESGNPGPQDTSRRKRKSWSDRDKDEDDESEKENQRPRQRRRSNSSSPIPSSQTTPTRKQTVQSSASPPSNQQSSPQPEPTQQAAPSARTLRRRLLRLRRKHISTIRAYDSLGTSYSEPISSLMYSLASELGRESNDLLWLAIIGVSSTELYGRTPTGLSVTNYDNAMTPSSGWTGTRGSRIRQILRDEVGRLNPPELTETGREVARGHATDIIPTYARSPTDTSIRLSPEPRFLLIRHWSLYDSMLHSPYLSARLHIWSDAGVRRLHKLLAKMGVSLSQCKQSYTHMDVELKKVLRQRLLHFAPMYGLDGLVPPVTAPGRGGIDRDGWGFVRCWGWKACLSAADVAVVIGAILEVGAAPTSTHSTSTNASQPQSSQAASTAEVQEQQAEEVIARFYIAYDALLSPTALTHSIPVAQSLHRAILRTGTSLLQKRQIRHLRAFRLAMVKEGPDVPLFCHPGALTKLALWVGEAVGEMERESGDDGARKGRKSGGPTPLVVACVDEKRDVYVVVGMGGSGSAVRGSSGKSEEETKAKKAKREAKAKAREEKRQRRREEKQKAKEAREANGDFDSDNEYEEDEETEDSASDSSEDESSDDEDAGGEASVKRMGAYYARNRFGNAFQEVVEETNARVRLDSFEHCVVEVQRDDLSGFLESLSMKAVVG